VQEQEWWWGEGAGAVGWVGEEEWEGEEVKGEWRIGGVARRGVSVLGV
jgi:hypothetical protein